MSNARLVVKLRRRITLGVLSRFQSLVVPKLNDADSLILRIDSFGGSVQVAHALAEFLQGLQGQVETYTSRGCRSAAVLVFAAGKRRVALMQSEFLVHEVSKKCTGFQTYSSALKLTQELRRCMDMTTELLEKATGRSAHLWEKDMMSNRVIPAQSARRIGLITQYGEFEKQKGDIQITL